MPVEDVLRFEHELIDYLRRSHDGILAAIRDAGGTLTYVIHTGAGVKPRVALLGGQPRRPPRGAGRRGVVRLGAGRQRLAALPAEFGLHGFARLTPHAGTVLCARNARRAIPRSSERKSRSHWVFIFRRTMPGAPADLSDRPRELAEAARVNGVWVIGGTLPLRTDGLATGAPT
mgnify:CR=1 FL=1